MSFCATRISLVEAMLLLFTNKILFNACISRKSYKHFFWSDSLHQSTFSLFCDTHLCLCIRGIFHLYINYFNRIISSRSIPLSSLTSSTSFPFPSWRSSRSWSSDTKISFQCCIPNKIKCIKDEPFGRLSILCSQVSGWSVRWGDFTFALSSRVKW